MLALELGEERRRMEKVDRTRIAGTLLVFLLVGAARADRRDGPAAGAAGEPGEPVEKGKMEALSFLALGDSYTIGEGVAANGRWPVQLARALRQGGVDIGDPRIVARTGWTVGELGKGIDAAAPQGPFALLSLLIGVNDQYRGGDAEVFRPALVTMLRRAVSLAGGRPGRVLVLSIPDWSVTPFAAQSGRDPGQIAQELRRFNEVVREETRRLSCRYVDITPESREARVRGELLAADGLHPSAAMYAEWVKLALPEAMAALAGS